MNHPKYTQIPAISFLVGLSLAATWISQSLMDLAFFGAVAVWIYYGFKDKSFFAPNRRLKFILPVMLAYFAVAALGFLINGRPEADVLFDLSRFFWIIQFVLLCYLVRHISFSHQKQWLFNFALLLLPALYALNFLWTDGNIDLLTSAFTNNRAVGLVNSATYHAHIGGFLVLVAAALVLAALKRKETAASVLRSPLFILFLAGFISFSLSLFYTKTRGAELAVILSFFVFAFLYSQKKIHIIILSIALVIAIAVGLKFVSSPQRAVSDQCRVLLLKVHYDIFKRFPVLGMGYRDNMRNLSDYWPEDKINPICDSFRLEGSHAHNQYINAAATTGGLGLLCYLSIVLFFFFQNWKWWRQEKSLVALSCFVLQVYFALSCMTDTTFEYAKIRILLLAVWAIVINRENFSEAG
jgi:O-antigen ligase